LSVCKCQGLLENYIFKLYPLVKKQLQF